MSAQDSEAKVVTPLPKDVFRDLAEKHGLPVVELLLQLEVIVPFDLVQHTELKALDVAIESDPNRLRLSAVDNQVVRQMLARFRPRVWRTLERATERADRNAPHRLDKPEMRTFLQKALDEDRKAPVKAITQTARAAGLMPEQRAAHLKAWR